MFDGVKGQFVRALGDGVDPKTIPAHFVAYYDEAVRMFIKFGHFSGVEDVPYNDWPLVCLMAELQFKNDQLEARLAALEAGNVTPLTYCVGANEPDPSAQKIDMRTKEGRALRQTQSVGA